MLAYATIYDNKWSCESHHFVDPKKLLEGCWRFLFIQCTLFWGLIREISLIFQCHKKSGLASVTDCFYRSHESCSFSWFSFLALVSWNLTIFPPTVQLPFGHCFAYVLPWISTCWSSGLFWSVFSFCPNFYIYFPRPYAHKSFQGEEYLHMHTNMCPRRHFGFDSHNFVREVWLVLSLICWWRNWVLVDLTTVTWLVKIARVTLDSRSSNFNSTFLKLPHCLFLYRLLKKASNDAP